MSGSTWHWQPQRARLRGDRELSGLTVADIPALLLTAVSAVTVTVGARLLRGQNSLLMLILAIGVAGATFVLDKLLVERLSALRPRQSLPALLACWMPMFLFATALATIATFSWIVPQASREELAESRRAHWKEQVDQVAAYTVDLRAQLKKQTDTDQAALEAERRAAASARQAGQPQKPEPMRRLQRRIAAARDVDQRLARVQPLPLEEPVDEAVARQELARVFRELSDLHASALLLVSSAPALPSYRPLTPPPTDLQSVLVQETKNGSWRALMAWGSAMWVELLPLLALWRGGRRIPLATRLLTWRCRTRDTIDALRGRASTTLPIVIEPLQVRGVVRVSFSGPYTLTDCSPLIEQAVGSLREVAGNYELDRVSNARGETVDENLPLLPQLNGQPLVLSVVEARS